jgi:hypothetical protein
MTAVVKSFTVRLRDDLRRETVNQNVSEIVEREEKVATTSITEVHENMREIFPNCDDVGRFQASIIMSAIDKSIQI